MAVAGAFIVPHPPLILPEIGRGEERKIQKTIDSYREIAKEAALMEPETVIILSPHSVMYQDYFHISPGTRAKGDFGLYGYPELQIGGVYDTEFVSELCGLAEDWGIAAGTEGGRGRELDHATMIPLYFLRRELADFKLVRIGLSGQSFHEHFRLGQCIAEAADRLERRIAVIASGDLSHCLMDSGPYEYTKEGPEYDKRVTEVMAGGNLQKLIGFSEEFCKNAGECGHRAFCIMAGCLDGKIRGGFFPGCLCGSGQGVPGILPGYGKGDACPGASAGRDDKQTGRGFCVFEEGRGAERLHRNHTGNL